MNEKCKNCGYYDKWYIQCECPEEEKHFECPIENPSVYDLYAMELEKEKKKKPKKRWI